MLWCLGSVALMSLLLGLAALTVRPLRLARRLHPAGLLRGCLALGCLLVALGVFALGLLLPR